MSPSTPRTELGFAWGFTVREASSISKVLLDCPFEGGYDLTIGTSERGRDIAQLASDAEAVPEFGWVLLASDESIVTAATTLLRLACMHA